MGGESEFSRNLLKSNYLGEGVGERGVVFLGAFFYEFFEHFVSAHIIPNPLHPHP